MEFHLGGVWEGGGVGSFGLGTGFGVSEDFISDIAAPIQYVHNS